MSQMPEEPSIPPKSVSLKPIHINVLALVLVIAIMALVYLNTERGVWRATASSLFSIPWTIQFVVLVVSANARRPPPPYVSKLTFALWAGAAYPFIGLMSPQLVFPEWFIAASAPIGFLMCYLLISVFMWMMTLIPTWRFPSAKDN